MKLFSVLMTACAVLIAVLGAGTASAAERSVPVELRVLTSGGEVLAEHVQYTRPIGLRTSPRADCFGQGTGGSGEVVRLGGRTALGALAQGARFLRSLRPILVTDHDFGFPGLGMCGIGGPTPAGQFWFLKTDRENPQSSGDTAWAKPNGTVLWYLMPNDGCDPDPPFACAPEMVLQAPPSARPGVPFAVRAFAYDDSGERAPVEGARIPGALVPTRPNGSTKVVLRSSASLRATKEGMVPSAGMRVCVSPRPATCPKEHGKRIVGSVGPDLIHGVKGGSDRIFTGPGRNRVNVRDGVADVVTCGRGRSLVVADKLDQIKRCAVVRRG